MGLKIKYNSPVILTFSLICVAVFFIPLTSTNVAAPGPMSEYFVIDGFGTFEDYLSLVFYIFGHASMEHLLGNLTFILLIGPIVEEKYGSNYLALMIGITAIVTGMLNIFFFSTGLLGASGIVFMLIILVSFTNVKSGQIPLTFILVMLLFIGKEIMQSLEADNISQFAHILGGICGSVFGFFGGGKHLGQPV